MDFRFRVSGGILAGGGSGPLNQPADIADHGHFRRFRVIDHALFHSRMLEAGQCVVNGDGSFFREVENDGNTIT